MYRSLILAAAAATFALPALACEGLHVHDPYARVSSPSAQSGAAFMALINHGADDCRLSGARSDIAARVELHTHMEDDAGVMRMIEVVEGFAIPAEGEFMLERGGAHIMFMGLNRSLAHGDEVSVTLVFEDGAETEVMVPVDLERQPDAAAHGHSHGHSGGHSHGD